jgi:hypothetical protein
VIVQQRRLAIKKGGEGMRAGAVAIRSKRAPMLHPHYSKKTGRPGRLARTIDYQWCAPMDQVLTA